MPTKLYVGNLPTNCSNDTIRDLFESYGNVVELSVIKNYAFVHYKNEEDASSAVRELNGTKLLGKQINVEVSKSKGKDKGSGNDKGDTSKGANDRGGGDRRQPRRDYSRRNDKSINPANKGGILGNGPGVDHLGPPNFENFGILSAVSTLAAAAEQQRNIQNQRNNMSFKDYRDHGDSLHDIGREKDRQPVASESDVAISDNRGYVIYERYYVDPTHPLLKGLPLPELPRIEDSFVSRPNDYSSEKVHLPRSDVYSSVDGKQPFPYSQVNLNPYRPRSPLSNRRDSGRDYEYRR